MTTKHIMETVKPPLSLTSRTSPNLIKSASTAAAGLEAMSILTTFGSRSNPKPYRNIQWVD